MKAVVLAGGEGERMRPLTYTRPKAMLQVAGKPLIWHVLSNLKKAGIKEAVVVVKYRKEQIIDYLAKEKLGMGIEFAVQGEKHGTAAAIEAALGKTGEDFLVVDGNNVCDSEIYRDVVEKHRGSKTVGLKKVDNPHGFGIAEVEDGVLTGMVEKPEHPKGNLANISVYAFNKSVFDEIRKLAPSPRGEYEITDVLKGAHVVETEDFWMDVGYPWHLFTLNEYLLGKMEANTGLVENSTVKGKLIMEEGAEVVDSFVEGASYIGAGTKIGPHALLRGFNSIGRNCEIGESTTVKNSILFDGVKAKHLTYIGDSVVGEGVNFGSGTQVANYRFDAGHVNVLTEKGWVNSGRKKLGVIVGDETKFGVLSCTMPGKMIGNGCWIGSGVVVNRNLRSGQKLFLKQEHVTTE
ncbi:MAG: sugar phosphate nucleotidyltransferase [Candidatus ainarchaeum sp.]|nr:sugar phosphate nucleotidyltransferase [Candidatus ainarchaeum sp.]MDD5096179.1 sugar phosphate nucleotidyltransferase [Candidatus ainarchaeum sp.]